MTNSSSKFYFDKASAQRACDFFEKFLVHTKGEWAGDSFKLLKWQKKEIIEPLFGWKKKTDDTRKFRTVFVEVPRKNGKSTLLGGLGLYLLFSDKEHGAEIYSCASDREQASIVFESAKSMVESSPELRKRCQIYRKAITVESTGSSYKVLSADSFRLHGVNAHGVLFDEVHAQKNRDLWDVLTTSVGARRQPIVFGITTAGIYDKTSICWELHDYAIKVRDGIIEDDSFLPVVYNSEKEDDWTDSKVWKKSNPSFGVSIKKEYLRQECERAKLVPAYQNTFRRLHLNQWTEQSTRWIDMNVWDECLQPINEAELVGLPCYAGIDLSSTTDMSAFSLVFPKPKGEFVVLPFYWIPEENMTQRSLKDSAPYDAWVRDEFVYATSGNIIDYEFIRKKINELGERFNILEVATDRWNATHLITLLNDDGFKAFPFGQGFASMSAPSKEFLNLVLSNKLIHGNNPVLRWNVSNVSVKQDASGNIKPDKSTSTSRIDGLVATIMALGRAIASDRANDSVYESADIKFL
jgi:phage terminase large subunit-like protein